MNLLNDVTILKFAFLCIAGFMAAFVDSIAGGGGLVSLPAFLLVGVSPHMALGTNKFAATCSSLTSSIKYATSGKVNYKLLKYLVPFSLIGAAIGVNTVMLIDERFLNTLVLVLILGVGVYSMFSKKIGHEDRFKGLTKKNVPLGILLALGMGFYDGFFGPGTGSFLMFGFMGIFGFDFVKAGGNARVLNFISNATSLVLFALYGRIDYMYGLPVTVFMVAGAYTGSRLAIKKGSNLVKPIFIIMSLAVAVKMVYGLVA